MIRPPRARVGIVLAVLGSALLAHGLWIPLKAAAAQLLLERAWQRTRGGEGNARPWPWADHRPVARIEVPRLGVSAIVLEGATGGSLAFGPGHLAGSARLGAPGNAVLAGHRDTHFAFLRELRVGDTIVVEPPSGAVRRYEVTDSGVVDEHDTSPLVATDDPTLTLITCFPFDAAVPGGPERFVVRANGLAASLDSSPVPVSKLLEAFDFEKAAHQFALVAGEVEGAGVGEVVVQEVDGEPACCEVRQLNRVEVEVDPDEGEGERGAERPVVAHLLVRPIARFVQAGEAGCVAIDAGRADQGAGARVRANCQQRETRLRLTAGAERTALVPPDTRDGACTRSDLGCAGCVRVGPEAESEMDVDAHDVAEIQDTIRQIEQYAGDEVTIHGRPPSAVHAERSAATGHAEWFAQCFGERVSGVGSEHRIEQLRGFARVLVLEVPLRCDDRRLCETRDLVVRRRAETARRESCAQEQGGGPRQPSSDSRKPASTL